MTESDFADQVVAAAHEIARRELYRMAAELDGSWQDRPVQAPATPVFAPIRRPVTLRERVVERVNAGETTAGQIARSLNWNRVSVHTTLWKLAKDGVIVSRKHGPAQMDPVTFHPAGRR